MSFRLLILFLFLIAFFCSSASADTRISYFNDSFDRANSATLGTGWVEGSSGMKIVDNHITAETIYSPSYISASNGQDDYSISFKIVTSSGADSTSVLRVYILGGYYMYFRGGGYDDINLCYANASIIESYNAPNLAFDGSQTYKIDCWDPANIKLYKNGVLLNTYETPGTITSGYAGFAGQADATNYVGFDDVVFEYEEYYEPDVPDYDVDVTYSSGIITIDNGYANATVMDYFIDDAYFSISGTDVVCNANIFITDDGGLTVTDSETITMNCSYDLEYTIENHGDMDINNSGCVQGTVNGNSTILNDDYAGTYYNYDFDMDGGIIRHMGSDSLTTPAIQFGDIASYNQGSTFTSYNSTFEYIEYDLFDMNDAVPFTGFVFVNNTVSGIYSTKPDDQLVPMRSNSVVDNNTFANIEMNLICVGSEGGTNIEVTNNTFTNVTTGRSIIESKHCNAALISGNTITDCLATLEAIRVYKGDIAVSTEAADTVIGNTITGQSGNGDASSGIAVYYGQDSGRNLIQDNYVSGASGLDYGIRFVGGQYTDIINLTVTGASYGIGMNRAYYDQYWYADDNIIKDSNITGSSRSVLFSWDSDDTVFINTRLNGNIYYDNDMDGYATYINSPYTGILYLLGSVEHRDYKYLNARTINTTGYAVESASITSDKTMFDGDGNIQATFTTDANGYLTELLAVPDYITTSSGTTQISSLITTSKDGETDSETVSPTSTWYSANVSDLQGTEIIFVLDVPGTAEEPISELLILDFSPSSNPTTAAREPLTITTNFSSICNVSILHNGTEVQSYSNVDNFSYSNSTAPAGTYNVTMVANDGTNEVSHTWTWTVESSSTGFTNPSFTQAVGGFTATVIAFAGLFFVNRRRN